MRWLPGWIAVLLLLLLAGCGGGNSTSTGCAGGNLNAQCQSPAVSLAYVQRANNMPLVVDSGVRSSFSLPVANTLYASVKVCEPDGVRCQTIDHVLVDTGSVGLRVMASQVSGLSFPAVAPAGDGAGLWECYPFVIGGLWGRTVQAVLGLGPLQTLPLPVQLIQDDIASGMQAPANCETNSGGSVMSSAAALGANGILGIGSVTMDCGDTCLSGNYGAEPNLKQYYACPPSATTPAGCASAAVPPNYQTANPVSFLPDGPGGVVYSNGIVIALPAVSGLGAASASGELIFGIDSQPNNQLGGAHQVFLGTDVSPAAQASYLGLTTLFAGQTLLGSYLDTGSNAYFFNDPAHLITPCASDGSPMTWYCPASPVTRSAQIQDGLAQPGAPVDVNFSVANAETLFYTTNAAFGNLAATAAVDPTIGAATFTWGLPFYFGRRVFQSIWDLTSPNGPWYAWTSL